MIVQFRNLTDKVLTVSMERESFSIEPHGFASFPDDWAPIFAARGTLLAPIDQGVPPGWPDPWPSNEPPLVLDDSDEAIAARVAEGLGVPVEQVTVTTKTRFKSKKRAT